MSIALYRFSRGKRPQFYGRDICSEVVLVRSAEECAMDPAERREPDQAGAVGIGRA